MKRTRQVGPYSRPSALAKLDGRTAAGRFVKAIQTELAEHVGAPNAAQSLLIKLASFKALRIALMADQVLTAEAIHERDDRQIISWCNSLRLDLQVLGIEGRGDAPPVLEAYLEGKAR